MTTHLGTGLGASEAMFAAMATIRLPLPSGIAADWPTAAQLRTVIWDFGGQPIAKELLDDLTRFRAELENKTALHDGLTQLLDASELGALRRRTDRLLATKHYPEPGPGRNYPWPPL